MKKKIKTTDTLTTREINAIWFDEVPTDHFLQPVETGANVHAARAVPVINSGGKTLEIPTYHAVEYHPNFLDTPQYKVVSKAVSWSLATAICIACSGGVVWVFVSVVSVVFTAITPICGVIVTGIGALANAVMYLILASAGLLALIKILPFLFKSGGGKGHTYPTYNQPSSGGNTTYNVNVNVGHGSQSNY
jgi:hypothetical protein